MPNNRYLWGAGGVLLIGLIATLGLPKTVKKTRLAARRLTGTTYRDGVASKVRPTVNPARAIAA